MSEQIEGKTLVIAEKPSVALDLTKVLPDKFKKEKTHYEGENYIVSYAVGHLLTIQEPNEMNPKFKSWTLKNLPIIPDDFKLKPIDRKGNKTQLTALAKLIRRKDVKHIINACDAGREGELIFRYIFDYVQEKRKVNKKKSRLWLQSMTPDAIRKGFETLRSDEEMFPLEDAARSRSEADWLIGINGSRGFTAYNSQMGGFYLTPAGRVQTPTLSMIVEREKERESFVPVSYWTLEAEFTAGKSNYLGKWFDPNFKKTDKDKAKTADKIWDEKKAKAIAEKCVNKVAQVTENTKPSSQKSPPLYDLTSLQREANSRFGFPAKMTLSLAQALYEKHKLITYPRTASKYLPEDYISQVKETMEAIKTGGLDKLKVFASEALKNNYVKMDRRIFNNKKVSDHFAIIPTTKKFAKKLAEAEEKIYNMIVQRFLAVFFPAAKFLNTTRISQIEDEYFKTEGKVLEYAGWKAIYSNQSGGEKLLAPLPKNTTVNCEEIDVNADETRPPARFSESTLLSAMENAGKMIEDEELKEAMKDSGLGTPATRAAIIEKLMSDKYVVREDRELVPTSKAFDLMDLIYAMEIEELKSPKLTGSWEHKLAQVERGEISRKDFMTEIENHTKHIVEKIKGFDEKSTRKEADFSPLLGMKWYESLTRYTSEDEEINIRKIMGGRKMSPEEMKILLTEKKIGPLEGFRSKRGNPFTASLTMNENFKVQFVFNNATDDEEIDLTKAEKIGESPIDGSPVYMTETVYVSESAMDKKKTGIKLNRVILGKEITLENMKKMLASEKTDLITGFRSNKTKRLFDAFLELNKAGKIKFSFPPPKRKKKAAKETPSKEDK